MIKYSIIAYFNKGFQPGIGNKMPGAINYSREIELKDLKGYP
jgi:hypothetical protein